MPQGRVLAIDQSPEMALARARLGDHARVWCQDVLELELEQPVDAVISTATLHWVPITIACGHGSRARRDLAGCSRCSAGAKATWSGYVRSSMRSPVSWLRS